MMRTPLTHMLPLALVCGGWVCGGCVFDSDEVTDETETESGDLGEQLAEQEVLAEHLPLYEVSFAPGTIWGPCTDEGWGCEGSLGVQLACLRPLSAFGLSVCVPQTWDEEVADDCSNVYDPGFYGGIELTDSEAYCVDTCRTDAGCVHGMLCSNYGICAWRNSEP